MEKIRSVIIVAVDTTIRLTMLHVRINGKEKKSMKEECGNLHDGLRRMNAYVQLYILCLALHGQVTKPDGRDN